MNRILAPKKNGFTLMETVIAIGVLVVMLTAFMGVFAPAAKGIRRAINVQEADRLTSALEKELATYRLNDIKEGSSDTAFNKAYAWIKNSHQPNSVIICYQYRGNPSRLRPDGSMEPFVGTNGVPGKDYVVQPMFRIRSNPLLADDLKAREGRVFFIRLTQLILDNNNGLVINTPGTITSPNAGANTTALTGSGADGYNDATLPFTAEFFEIPTTEAKYISPGGGLNPANIKVPIFTRNLAVRR